MLIGVDIDGVVADFVDTFLQVARERYALNLERADIYVHDLFLVLGIPEDETVALVRSTLQRDLALVDGAREGLTKLKAKHRIVLLTARPSDLRDVTLEWLKRRAVPYDEIIWQTEGNKHRVELRLDVVIDDHLREAIRFHGVARTILLFDNPWNRSFNAGGVFQRVHNWNEIVRFIEEMQ